MYSPKLLLNLKKLKLDIVHTQTEFPIGIFGKVVSEIYRIPLVHTYHTMYEDYVHYVANGHLITPAMAKAFSRVFCNQAKVVVAPVEKTRQSLLAYGVKRPIEIIPTGLDFSNFARGKYTKAELEQAKIEIGLNSTDPVIVYVGRIAKEKSLDVVIRTMAELLVKIPDAKLVIVGDGPLKGAYEEMANQLKIAGSVIFTGARPWAQIGKYYQIGDVFTTASTSETQGLTYIEAMAAQVPVVAKQDQSVEGIVEHGKTGYLFQNDEQLCGLLYRALANKAESQAIAERGYNSIQRLSAQRFAEDMENLYKRIISETGQKPRRFTIKPIT